MSRWAPDPVASADRPGDGVQTRARLRQREVLQLLARWGWKPGVPSLIAAHLGVHRSTITRDPHALMPLYRECPTCRQLWPREGWWEE